MEHSPMEPPTKRWKKEDKSELVRELAVNSLFLKNTTEPSESKHFFDDMVIQKEMTLDDLIKAYENHLKKDKTYETNHILNLVYYPFTSETDTAESTLITEEKNTQLGFDPKIFFILHFRQYFRMIRRLVYFTYIQQGMIEECTRFNFKELKLHHKFYESKLNGMTPERQDRIARGMHLEEYVHYHEIKRFAIQEAATIPETQSNAIPLLSVDTKGDVVNEIKVETEVKTEVKME